MPGADMRAAVQAIAARLEACLDELDALDLYLPAAQLSLCIHTLSEWRKS